MNKKGHVILGVAYLHLNTAAATALSFKFAFMAIAAACIWHIPAWDKAKANHTEAEYQAQQMWPQQLFAKLPGGSALNVRANSPQGNGGNFAGGIQNGG